MRKFIYLAMVFVCFVFIYLVAFTSYVEAGGAPTTCITTCDVVCDGSAVCSGTDDDDIICGTSSGEEIRAGMGDDIVCGFGGNDTLKGGFGCDSLFGSEGDDDLLGGHCPDYFDGGEGYEVVGDTCLGGFGSDIFTVTGNCETSDQGQTGNHKTQGNCGGCTPFIPYD